MPLIIDYSPQLSLQEENESQQVIIRSGHSKELLCEIISNNDLVKSHTVKWLFNGQHLIESLEWGIVRYDRENASVILILNIQQYHEGKYECFIENTLIKEAFLIVLTENSPFIEIFPNELTVKEGDEVEWVCQINNIPTIQKSDLTWYFMRNNSEESLRYEWTIPNQIKSFQTTFIILKKSEIVDEGYYVCRVPEKFGMNINPAMSRLIIIGNGPESPSLVQRTKFPNIEFFPPIINSQLVKEAGSTLYQVCSVKSNKDNDDEEEEADNGGYQIHWIGPNGKQNVTEFDFFVIPRINNSHAGKYTCVVTNISGNEQYRKSFTLIIKDKNLSPPTFEFRPPPNSDKLEVKEGLTIYKICATTQNNNDYRFYWTNSEGSKRISESQVLLITDSLPSQSGEYTCVATHVISKKVFKKNFRIVIKDKIKSIPTIELFPQVVNNVIEGQVGSHIYQTCTISLQTNNKNEYRFYWIGPSKKHRISTTDYFFIASMNESHVGEYTCVAVHLSSHKEIRKTIQLVIQENEEDLSSVPNIEFTPSIGDGIIKRKIGSVFYQQCFVKNNTDEYQMHWVGPDFHNIQPIKSYLYMKNVNNKNVGVYLCVATHIETGKEFGKSLLFVIDGENTPKFQVSILTRPDIPSIGKYFSLQCIPNPKPLDNHLQIQWFVNKKFISNNLSLEFPKVQKTDLLDSLYECHVTMANQTEIARKFMKINIYKSQNFVLKSTTNWPVVFLLNEIKELHCEVNRSIGMNNNNNNSQQVTWSFRGISLQEKDFNIQLINRNNLSRIRFSSMKKYHEGFYECKQQIDGKYYYKSVYVVVRKNKQEKSSFENAELIRFFPNTASGTVNQKINSSFYRSCIIPTNTNDYVFNWFGPGLVEPISQSHYFSFLSLSENQTGDYHCVTNNTITGQSYYKTFKLIVSEPLDFRLVITENSSANLDEDYILSCTTEPLQQGAKYYWFVNGKLASTESQLVIKSLQRSDILNLKFDCKVTIDGKNMSLDYPSEPIIDKFFSVQLKPYSGYETIAVIGDRKELHCQFNNSNNNNDNNSTSRKFTWNFQGQYSRLNSRIGVDETNGIFNSILTLDNVQRSHEGKYQCQMGNVSKEVSLIVINDDPPSIEIYPNEQTVLEGGLVEFNCLTNKIPGVMSSDLQWFYLGSSKQNIEKPLRSDWIKRQSQSLRNTDLSFAISLSNVQASDAGYYVCKLTQKHLNITTTTTTTKQQAIALLKINDVQVTVWPKLVQITENILPINIKCEVIVNGILSGNPKWRFVDDSGKNIEENQQFVIYSNSSGISNLVVKQMLPNKTQMQIECFYDDLHSDAMNITLGNVNCNSTDYFQCKSGLKCFEKNKLCNNKRDCPDGSDEHAILCDNKPPTIVFYPPRSRDKEIEIVENEIFYQFCSSSSDSDFYEFYWIGPDKISQISNNQFLSFSHVNKSHSGEYTCVAKQKVINKEFKETIQLSIAENKQENKEISNLEIYPFVNQNNIVGCKEGEAWYQACFIKPKNNNNNNNNNNSSFNYHWLGPNNQQVSNKQFIFISQIKRSQAGQYSCIATNSLTGETFVENLRLVVKGNNHGLEIVPNEITIEQRQNENNNNSFIKFICQVNSIYGLQSTDIQWYFLKTGQPLHNKWTIVNQDDNPSTSSSISLETIDNSDDGYYLCTILDSFNFNIDPGIGRLNVKSNE